MIENKKKIDIVMTTWERPELTELSIKAIAKNTLTPSRLTVIDNGSSKEMKKMLLGLKNLGLIHNLVLMEENIGLEPAKNIGMAFVRSDLFISTDNDCLPEKPNTYYYGRECWLGRLIQLMEKYPEYAAISARTQVMIGTGNIFDGHEADDVVQFPHPGGSLRIMRTDLVNEVGGWRKSVDGRGSEEKYICGKFNDMGLKTGFATEVKCYHMFGKQNWGYPEDWRPERHGHTLVWHPAIINGDDDEEIKKYI